jgi:hypothetical protein
MNHIFRKRVGEFHSTQAQATALKDQGKDSTVTADTQHWCFERTFVEIANSY